MSPAPQERTQVVSKSLRLRFLSHRLECESSRTGTVQPSIILVFCMVLLSAVCVASGLPWLSDLSELIGFHVITQASGKAALQGPQVMGKIYDQPISWLCFFPFFFRWALLHLGKMPLRSWQGGWKVLVSYPERIHCGTAWIRLP